MSVANEFSNLIHGPLQASPFPVPPLETIGLAPPFHLPAINWSNLVGPTEKLPYFNALQYFVQCYGVLPWCRVYQLEGFKRRAWLLETLATRYDLRQATVAHAEFFEEQDIATQFPFTALHLAPHLLLEMADEQLFQVGLQTQVTLYYSTDTDPDILDEISRLLYSRLKREKPPVIPNKFQIHLLTTNSFGTVVFEPMSIAQPTADLATHYNDDLLYVHNIIVRRLQTDHDKGLVILHGPPGTGKTSYLRHLCGLLPGKNILLVPPHLAAHLADPSFMGMLNKKQNSILIIEDAEQLLLRREKSGAGPSAVSGLLNLTDGFMADVLHIQVVCTFNTDLALIDPALLRKGRLIAACHFGPLSASKTQALAASLGWTAPSEPLTLAEIYNHCEPSFAPAPTASVGFGRREPVA